MRIVRPAEFAWPLDDVGGAEAWVLFDVPPVGHRPPVRLELATHVTGRLVAGDHEVARIAIARGHMSAAIRWTPGEPSRSLPPIERRDAVLISRRRTPAQRLDAWVRRFHQWLAPDVGPLDYGTWLLRLGALERMCRQRFAHPPRSPFSQPQEHAWTLLPWTLSGADYLVCQRRIPSPESGRVKALRKLARDGILPPLLVWPIDAFGITVLLDGHARLSAALAERVLPDTILLSSVRPISGRAASPDAIERAAIGMMREQQFSRGLGHRAADTWARMHDDRPSLDDRTHAYRWVGGRAEWMAGALDPCVAGDARAIEIARETIPIVAGWRSRQSLRGG